MATPIVRIRPTPVIRTVESERRKREFPRKPIYVSWSSGVDGDEGHASVEGVHDVLRAGELDWQVLVFGSLPIADGDYGSPDWYQDRSMFNPKRDIGLGAQVNANQVLVYLANEPYQQQRPHYDVMLLDRDCSTGNTNFVFGAAWPKLGYVESVSRLRPGIDRQLRLRLIQRCTSHEFGHVLGLPARGWNVEQSLGTHCTNAACCMRQGVDRKTWIEQLQEEERVGVIFCRECRTELRQLR